MAHPKFAILNEQKEIVACSKEEMELWKQKFPEKATMRRTKVKVTKALLGIPFLKMKVVTMTVTTKFIGYNHNRASWNPDESPIALLVAAQMEMDIDNVVLPCWFETVVTGHSEPGEKDDEFHSPDLASALDLHEKLLAGFKVISIENHRYVSFTEISEADFMKDFIKYGGE